MIQDMQKAKVGGAQVQGNFAKEKNSLLRVPNTVRHAKCSIPQNKNKTQKLKKQATVRV